MHLEMYLQELQREVSPRDTHISTIWSVLLEVQPPNEICHRDTAL